MTNRMHKLVSTFNDIIYLDATHKSNRFNLPLLDCAIVNNLGKTSTCFWSLISDHKYESYHWALTQFKNAINTTPKTFLIDEEEALLKGSLISH